MALTYKIYNDWGRQFNRLKTLESLWAVNNVRIDLGSDATGDIFTRNSSGFLQKVPIGSPGDILSITTDMPLWKDPNTLFWGLSGNSLTNPSTHFIGTIDDQPLLFKVNNQVSGKILKNYPWNTFFGYQAGMSSTGGINVAFGWGALADNTLGDSNCAFGLSALGHALSSENIGIGFGAGAKLTNHRNVLIGTGAGTNSVNSFENTTVGNYTMLANRQGSNCVAIGSSALRGNVKGINNVAVGIISLTQNTTNIDSISIVSGGTGYTTATIVISAPNVSPDPNNNSQQATATAVISGGVIVDVIMTQKGKGYTNITDAYNTGVTAVVVGDGTGAVLQVNLRSGEYNTAIGSAALALNLTGQYLTALGFGAGSAITSGDYNVLIGGNNGSTINGLSNQMLFSDGQGNIRFSVNELGIFKLQTVPPEYTDNADAITNGLVSGQIYRTGDVVKVVH